jgi:hypothetical protein
VQVFGYSSGQFQPALNSLFGPQAAAALGSIQSYVLVVTNTSGVPVVNAAVRYPRIDSSGKTIDGDMRFAFGDRLSLSPAPVFVLAPEPNLSKVLNEWGSQPLSPQSLASMASSIAASRFNPGRFAKATVSLDSVVFSDGGVLGPDVLGFIATERAKAGAETDILTHLGDTSISDDQLIPWLGTFDIRAVPPDSRTGLRNPVQVYKAAFARAVLGFVKEHGRPQTAQWIKDIQAKRVPPTSTLHPIR